MLAFTCMHTQKKTCIRKDQTYIKIIHMHIHTYIHTQRSGKIALAGSYSDHVFWIVPDDFTHIGEEGADLKVM